MPKLITTPIAGVKTQLIEVPPTPRMLHEAERWKQFGRKPEQLVSPGPGQQSVWDFPRPPALERVLDRVRVEFAGECVADTEQAIRVCETASPPTYYIPLTDVASEFLRTEAGSTYCEWKGAATYHSLIVGEQHAPQCAWSYATPNVEYEVLQGAIAFYPGRVDRCLVGTMEVTSQLGDFYGGWITPDLVGPFKGEPGTTGW